MVVDYLSHSGIIITWYVYLLGCLFAVCALLWTIYYKEYVNLMLYVQSKGLKHDYFEWSKKEKK